MKEISHHNKPRTILIVDDDKDDQFFLTKAIKEVVPMASVQSFIDGTEVMEYLYARQGVPDLIFLDLNMRKMNGRSTVALIKQDEFFLQRKQVDLLREDASYTMHLIELKAGQGGSYFFCQQIGLFFG